MEAHFVLPHRHGIDKRGQIRCGYRMCRSKLLPTVFADQHQSKVAGGHVKVCAERCSLRSGGDNSAWQG